MFSDSKGAVVFFAILKVVHSQIVEKIKGFWHRGPGSFLTFIPGFEGLTFYFNIHEHTQTLELINFFIFLDSFCSHQVFAFLFVRWKYT